ncbi:YdeI/OmpD-associated family protein [Streptomyces sp. DSM 40712]|uniref:YdeI/OmpD-associated family protein n=2 Tax=Streptomyces lancefieldiae TaxID=3075520 RepID=A0ABU3B3W9_9ACTN|nr:YdeI/OmpD-associated family protein [Streptomyces sp. DSM 40712]MDT0615691.1 YdeI/OmpD-associated family protein [Streptomyces sp. DSM 40712]
MPEGARKSPDPVLFFATQDEWEKWLEENHEDVPGVWFRIPKSGSGADGVDYAHALESALCHGWIDGQKKKLDERHWLQRFTPRRPGSKWSEVNREKATELIDSGRMRPAGLREVEKAKADGRWESAYAPQSKATVPDDLQAALDAVPEARDFFTTLDSRNRYAVLYRIEDAKKPETRAARIEKFVAMLEQRKKLY